MASKQTQPPTVGGLQKRCKSLQLSTAGKKADLVKRLQDHLKTSLIEFQDDIDTEIDGECDAILVSRSVLGDDEGMKRDAKIALQQTLQEEELHIEETDGEMYVGNRRGLQLAGLPARVRALEQQVALSKDEISTHKDEITSLKAKTNSLEDRVSSLTNSLDAYKVLRNRFISTFKRDKLKTATDTDKRIIAEGNSWAHGGDAVVDASLYSITSTHSRRDALAYERLYGMDPARVLLITHKETIAVLNTHAGVISSNYKRGSDRFYALFAEFVKLFKESGEGYDEGYLDGNPTSVTRAYWAFMDCIKDEVTTVEAAEASD